MNRRQLISLGLSAVLCSILALNTSAQIAVLGETVYTMDGPPVADGVVLIEDGKIVAVGPRAEVGVPATNDPVLGKALDAASAQGEVIKVLINCVNPYISA